MAWHSPHGLAHLFSANASPAARLLRGEPNGIAISFETEYGSLCVRDAATPANNKDGLAIDYLSMVNTNGGINAVPIRRMNNGLYRYVDYNVAMNSEDFTVGNWTRTACTVTLAAIAAPNGAMTGNKLAGNTTGTGTVGMAENGRSDGMRYGAPASFGICLKAGTLSWARIQMLNVTGKTISAYFNLATGAIGTLGADNTASVKDMGGGWWRCAVHWQMPINDNGGDFAVHLADADGDTTVDRTSATYIYAWGAQSNIGTELCRYRPTPGTATALGPWITWDGTGDKYHLITEQQVNTPILWNRALTDAVWVKTNVTAAIDQTGIDGYSNVASSILATAANATIIQTITLASSSRITSAFVKRLIGTGTVEMTQNGGTNWTPVTVTADWTRVSLAAATVVNPAVGFRLAVSGDKIAVDFVMCEDHETTYKNGLVTDADLDIGIVSL